MFVINNPDYLKKLIPQSHKAEKMVQTDPTRRKLDIVTHIYAIAEIKIVKEEVDKPKKQHSADSKISQDFTDKLVILQEFYDKISKSFNHFIRKNIRSLLLCKAYLLCVF